MKKLVIIFLSISILLSACQKQTDVATLEQNKPTLEKALMELRTVIMKQSPPTIARQKKSNQVTKEWRSDLTASIGFVPQRSGTDRKSTRLNSSHSTLSRMPSSA